MMKKTACRIIITILLGGSMLNISAQTGFYVPKKGKVFFKGDTATIFSNVQNAGKLGVGKQAVVNFKGKRWQNEAQSMITDTSDAGEGATGEGGWVRFIGDDMQELDGGYNGVTKTGATFSRLQVNNPFGLQLAGSTSKIRHELQFKKGHLFLRDHILIIGNGNPGSINGYDFSRFIVTRNKPGGGLLVREHITAADGVVVFPIGSGPGAYTPAGLRTSASQGDDYYMSVFDGVYQHVTTGTNLQPASVNKTWEIGKLLRPDEDDTEIFLEHLIADEGQLFNANRKRSFVSSFTNGQWDTAMPQQLPTPGMFTTGRLLHNSGMNSRLLNGAIGSGTFFTKFTVLSLSSSDRTRVWLNAYRTDKENVRVFWSTKPEVNNHYFVVQRRLSNEAGFRNIDTVYSTALNGNSTAYLHYTLPDPNNYEANSYYRLMVVDRSDQHFYSNIAVVNGRPGGLQLLLWPNPSTGVFYLGINGEAAVKSIVIWDVKGRKLREEAVNERTIMEMRMYIPGTYMVGFIGYGGQILETKKLVIQPY